MKNICYVLVNQNTGTNFTNKSISKVFYSLENAERNLAEIANEIKYFNENIQIEYLPNRKFQYYMNGKIFIWEIVTAEFEYAIENK